MCGGAGQQGRPEWLRRKRPGELSGSVRSVFLGGGRKRGRGGNTRDPRQKWLEASWLGEAWLQAISHIRENSPSRTRLARRPTWPWFRGSLGGPGQAAMILELAKVTEHSVVLTRLDVGEAMAFVEAAGVDINLIDVDVHFGCAPLTDPQERSL